MKEYLLYFWSMKYVSVFVLILFYLIKLQTLFSTVKLGLMATPKWWPLAQDYRFISVPFFHLGTQAPNNVSKKTTFIQWYRSPPILTKSDQSVIEDNHVIVHGLFCHVGKYCLGHVRKFLYKETFRNTTCLWWPLYI